MILIAGGSLIAALGMIVPHSGTVTIGVILIILGLVAGRVDEQ